MNKRLGFTLIELLIVVLIICILFGLFMPVVNSARGAARKVKCMNNERQLGVAILSYAEDNNGQLPAGYDENWVPWMTTVTNVLVAAGIPQKSGTYPAVFQCPSAVLAGGANHYIASPGVLAMVCRGAPARQIRARTVDMRSDLIVLSDGMQEVTYGNSTRELIFCGTGWAGYFHDGTGALPDGDDLALSISPVIPEGTNGFYTSWRHNNRCNSLYGDGHVASNNFNTEITQGQFQILRGHRKWEWESWIP